MTELGARYYSNEEYRDLFNVMIDSNICEDFAVGMGDIHG